LVLAVWPWAQASTNYIYSKQPKYFENVSNETKKIWDTLFAQMSPKFFSPIPCAVEEIIDGVFLT
jgi:hypothetical protein